MESVQTILSEVERLPRVDVEIDDAGGSAEVRVGARVVARLDLRDGGVLVEAPADRIPLLHEAFPSSRSTEDGIAFDLGDSECCSEALEAIRRRVNVERLVWQFRASSP